MNTKQILLSAAAIACSATAFTSAAVEFTQNGIVYDGNGTNATITGYTSDLPANVVIGEGVRSDAEHNYQLVKVNDNAFAGCEIMTSLTFSATTSKLTFTIGDNAFAAPNLKTVTVMRSYLPTVEGDPFGETVYAQAKLDIWKGLTEEQQNAYRTTEPWSKFSEVQLVTGLSDINPDESAISVNVHNGNVAIDAPEGTNIEIYTFNGMRLYAGKQKHHTLPTGIYVVKAGDKVMKVAV